MCVCVLALILYVPTNQPPRPENEIVVMELYEDVTLVLAALRRRRSRPLIHAIKFDDEDI